MMHIKDFEEVKNLKGRLESIEKSIRSIEKGDYSATIAWRYKNHTSPEFIPSIKLIDLNHTAIRELKKNRQNIFNRLYELGVTP